MTGTATVADTQPPGDDASAALSEPLAHDGQGLGLLSCGSRLSGTYMGTDANLLATLARQVALALHNAGLSLELARRVEQTRRQAEQLAAARARIVQAEEAGRRRIGRDIHDGVQQQLVALIAKAQLAELQLAAAPPPASATVRELKQDAGQVLADLRELVNGIHPAVLTDHGLVEAVTARLRRLPLPSRLETTPEVDLQLLPQPVQ